MRIGLAVIVGAEVNLIDTFILYNNIFANFNEIKFLCDTSTDGTVEKLREWEKAGTCKVYERDLNFNFSEQRNFLNSLMESEYILRLDIDEVMSNNLVNWIKKFNPKKNKDLYIVTRQEKVEGKTIKYSSIQFLYKNKPEIKWKNKLHEVLEGFDTCEKISSNCLLIHDKSKTRCVKQNKYYYDNYEIQRKIVNTRRKKK